MPVFGSRIYAWWQCCWWCCCVVPPWYVWIEQTAVPSAWKKRGVPTVKVILPREAILSLCYRLDILCVLLVCVRVLQFVLHHSMYCSSVNVYQEIQTLSISTFGVPSDETWIDSKLYNPGPGGLNWGEKLLWNIFRTTIDVSLLFCKLGVTGWPVNWRWLHLHSQSWGPKKRVTFASWCCFWRTRYIHRILV